MNMGLHFELRAPRPSIMNMKDIDNVRKRYPQKKEGTLKWVVAGGGASKLLIEGMARGRTIRNVRVEEDMRSHKDLDLFLFNGEDFEGKCRYPHEIFGVDNYGPLKSIDYSKGHADYFFYVETMRGCYIGFFPPEKSDVIEIKVGRNWVQALSPEFVIASKIFSTHGIREEDLDDVKWIIRKYRIEHDYLEKLMIKSKFALVCDRKMIENIENLIEDGKYTDTVSERIMGRFPDPFVFDLNYNSLASLLDYYGVDPLAVSLQGAFLLEQAAKNEKDFMNPNALLSMRYLLNWIEWDLDYFYWRGEDWDEKTVILDKKLDSLLQVALREIKSGNIRTGMASEIGFLLSRFYENLTSENADEGRHASFEVTSDIAHSLIISPFKWVIVNYANRRLDEIEHEGDLARHNNTIRLYFDLKEKGWVV